MRIDVHHHFFPPSIDKAKSGGDVGFKTPPAHLPWSPEVSLGLMDELNIDLAILSLPAIAAGNIGEPNRKLARDRNIYLAGLRDQHPKRFGFFATVPFFDDVEGVIQEIKYALDELHADGISLPSSYGIGADAKYVGHDDYDVIWAELDRRNAVVFLHGAQTPSSTPYPHFALGIPISEVPNETFKAAAHLVVSGRKRKYSHVKIILAHLGGSSLNLASRVAGLSPYMGCRLSADDIMNDFKAFYFDTALSSSDINLYAADRYIGIDRLLFGTDLPAVTADIAQWYMDGIQQFFGKDESKLNSIFFNNALTLFPRLKNVLLETP